MKRGFVHCNSTWGTSHTSLYSQTYFHLDNLEWSNLTFQLGFSPEKISQSISCVKCVCERNFYFYILYFLHNFNSHACTISNNSTRSKI